MLESPRVVARLVLAPTRRQRRAAAAIVGAGAWIPGPAAVTPVVMVVALAAVWHLIPGIWLSAIFVIVMAAVVAPPPVHLVSAVAVAAPAMTPLTTIRATAMMHR